MRVAQMLFVGLLAALLPNPALAQTVTGNLDGRVTDPAGAAVHGAQVGARSAAMGVERRTQTNPEGYFEIPFLPIGTYDVSVTMKGFATLVAQRNMVTLNKTTTLNLSLQVSEVQVSVTVSDVAPMIDVTSGQIRRSIDDVMVSQLPVAGRDFRSIVNIFPGVQS